MIVFEVIGFATLQSPDAEACS